MSFLIIKFPIPHPTNWHIRGEMGLMVSSDILKRSQNNACKVNLDAGSTDKWVQDFLHGSQKIKYGCGYSQHKLAKFCDFQISLYRKY